MNLDVVLNEGKKTLSEQAYEAIREAILTLRLKPGQDIYESELANMLDMSRTPIREAVRLLAMEDLIEILPQRGMKVTLISESKVEETRFVREMLEIGALRKVMEQWAADKAEYQGLQRELHWNLEAQRQAQAKEDFVAFLRLDEAFHRQLLQATGNMTLISMVTKMRFHLNRVRTLTLNELKNTEELIREHGQLLTAIQDGDTAAAIHILTRHLRRLSVDIDAVKRQYPSYFAVKKS
ncbi:GntR family transcriptional regulator [Alicyclobacillus contaminans]|uniref:GntR family transcriptional regulator n=1 Tax=Alicyclobacillus contaminans TaxID=392016 RepID=UPI000403C2F7|nr:GntR family transcriptional regulator [Alicyclobacillus contaminans]GMA51406.1 GntR family transcriptional regulator [Alicyclobacillus contaminans]